MMEWVLDQFIRKYIHEYKTLRWSGEVESGTVDPLEWSPMNINFGNVPRVHLSRHNLGFIFKTTGEFVKLFPNSSTIPIKFPELEPDRQIYIKYLSAILDIDHAQSYSSISWLFQLEPNSTVSASSNSDSQDQVQHPYLGILHVQGNHQIIVMDDVGQSLFELLSSPSDAFRREWKQSKTMRDAFYSGVGLSALNLVHQLDCCHNDIRPSNIAYQDGTFCLIDFDMTRHFILNQPKTSFSPLIRSTHWNSREKLMFFTVAQIAVTIFMLSAEKKFAIETVSKSHSIWTTERKLSAVDKAFQKWSISRGSLVHSFVEEVREAGAASKVRKPSSPHYKEDYKKILKAMLV